MTLIELATTIGDILTEIDTRLQTPGLSDADWQTLYALRKHLDDQQRALIEENIKEEDATFQALTSKISDASNKLASIISDLTKVGNVISTVSQIAADVDQVLKLVAAA
ncbi:MAG TPA: hypothetical protein VMW54_15605 [Terriglobia bacterium]|nr:hypothetical protein [Terriglobia bacterium]